MPNAEVSLSLTNRGTIGNAGSKRSRGDAEPDAEGAVTTKKQKKAPMEPEVIDPNVCGNCGGTNHKAAFCVKTGQSGWMEACPKCDSKRHMYEGCPKRDKGEDFTYLIFNRQRKPPVKSMMKLGKVIKNELERPGTQWPKVRVLELPYSSKFARQEARQNPPESWTYPHVGDPVKEAEARTPEPSRTDITLDVASRFNSISAQVWSYREEIVNFEDDGPIPTMHTLVDRGNYTNQPAQPVQGVQPVQHVQPVQTVQPALPVRLTRSIRSARRLEPAPQRRREQVPTGCVNCGKEDHVVRMCVEICAACGSGDHVADKCQGWMNACICARFPHHFLAQCERLCNYCFVFRGVAVPHRITDCPSMCHYCLATGHTTKECPKPRTVDRTCESCSADRVKEQYHFASECVLNLCPVKGCSDPLHCNDHCKGCGWKQDEIALIRSHDREHKCQFTKIWHKDEGGGHYVIKLACKDCGSRFKHEEVLEVRAKALEEIEQLLKTPEGFENWRVECPKCRIN